MNNTRSRIGIAPINVQPALASPQIAPILRQGDQTIMNSADRLGNLLGKQQRRATGGKVKNRFADGGKVANTIDSMKLIKDAIDSLRAGDASSARTTLGPISDPTVRAASADLMRGSGGVRLAIQKLEDLVRSFSDQQQVPLLAEGGKVTNAKKLISSLKDSIFGESDEPDWATAQSLLKKLPGSEAAQKKLSEYQKFLSSDGFTDDENLRRATELENHINQLTPGKKVPNPND